MSLDSFLKHIDSDNLFAASLAHHERLAAQPPQYETTITPLNENILNALREFGIEQADPV